MSFRNFIILLTAILLQPAHAEFATVINAVETAPSNIHIPATVNNMMTFKPCPYDCGEEYTRVRITSATTFRVQGEPVKFEYFRKQFAGIKYSKDGYALVSYETKTKTVTSIDIARL